MGRGFPEAEGGLGVSLLLLPEQPLGSLGMIWPNCPSWPCASKRVCGYTPQFSASSATVPRKSCFLMAGSSPKVLSMTRGGGWWSHQQEHCRDHSLLSHRKLLCHQHLWDSSQPVSLAGPWGAAFPTLFSGTWWGGGGPDPQNKILPLHYIRIFFPGFGGVWMSWEGPHSNHTSLCS